MSDLISREETKKAFTRINDLRTLSLGKVGEVLDSLPSAEAEWIPCSERLPKEDSRYLVQMSYGIMQVLSWANILEKVDDFDFRNKKHSGWYEYDSEWGYCERHEAVAWMPLPKPYREDGER